MRDEEREERKRTEQGSSPAAGDTSAFRVPTGLVLGSPGGLGETRRWGYDLVAVAATSMRDAERR